MKVLSADRPRFDEQDAKGKLVLWTSQCLIANHKNLDFDIVLEIDTWNRHFWCNIADHANISNVYDQTLDDELIHFAAVHRDHKKPLLNVVSQLEDLKTHSAISTELDLSEEHSEEIRPERDEDLFINTVLWWKSCLLCLL